ncbi:MAG: DUF3656 domain-containing U32 family peptidase, partial [Terrimicrobiaceae bacterium]
HGALCVAYSGQCLTSESLGQRSANRGECAQACRMPYEIVVDGETRDLGDKRYLLSPQDLAAVKEIPELIRLGVKSFKIEGRLKTPEYVAAVTSVYRKAIDDAAISVADFYKLEMTFSRGLFTGWMHGVDHQNLVRADYGKKRGVFAGRVVRAGRDFVEVDAVIPLKAGEGVVFENASDTNAEQGGRIYEVRHGRLAFEHGKLATDRILPGTRFWKTSDPVLERELKKSWQARIAGDDARKKPLTIVFSGQAGESLSVQADGITVSSRTALQSAQKFALNADTISEIFARLNDTPYRLNGLDCDRLGHVYLAKSDLTHLKHELVKALEEREAANRKPSGVTLREALDELLSELPTSDFRPPTSLPVLCRTTEQIEAALNCGIKILYADFEDIRRYKDAVTLTRGRAEIFLATPRIQKAGEQGFFKLIESAAPDGVLIRNVGAISYFQNSPLRTIGDFSLNVSNPASAAVFLSRGLERVTISYDLNITQVLALLAAAPADRLELTIHQHMPMFHMEHCVFAAFLSKGSTFLDCGRPCEKHRVHLRDRVGIEHPLRADVGCRNTLFNAAAQTGAAHFEDLCVAGL